MLGLDYRVKMFLGPYTSLIKTKYLVIKDKYNITSYIFYNGFMYYSNVKQEIIWGYTHIDFDGDPPQDVLV